MEAWKQYMGWRDYASSNGGPFEVFRKRRLEEMRAEDPVPFCCPGVSSMVVAAYPDITVSLKPEEFREIADGPPKWCVHHAGEGFTTLVPIRFCPVCGSELPKLVKKDPAPPHLQRTGASFGSYTLCGLCSHTFASCLCARPKAAWEASGAPPVFAATTLLTKDSMPPHKRSLVLSVSRKGDHSDKGLPGGKLDPGETPEAAARRELLEETGLVVGSMHVVFDAVDDTGKRCVTFRVTDFTGELTSRESGLAEWVPYSALTYSSSFKSYNEALLRRIDPFEIIHRR